ncbi:MAG: thiamine-phosphate kinase [Euryarchaeota archaeon]|nr:thiamine-phosphate kinase [Euryarchaeota archaeon]
MTLYELGETAIVNRIVKRLDIEFEDCAILDFTDTEYLVATTDMFHRVTDFPVEMSAWQIGWMCAAATLSDIAAMGARPEGMLVSMGLPDVESAFVDSMIEGMDACVRRCGTAVIGGDTDSHQELTICGTALGRVPKNQILRRRGANVGDLVCITGRSGMAGAGMAALGKGLTEQEMRDSIAVKKFFEPIPRIKEGIRLAESGAVTAMMDNSDGLALSLHQLAETNGCGFRICADLLPVLSEPEGSQDPDLALALYSGGDFELLFTVGVSRLADARRACELTVIGEVTSEGVFLDVGGGDRSTIEAIERRGYRSLVRSR